ncbi:MAG TPA: exodeoxyribonuclease III [Chloroflexia bacterium]|nr:exodeoxyribonuclease III [Chloroflexia bacterium]
MTLTIASWNVNSIAARLPLALQWLNLAHPDVVCLQEIKCVDEKFPAADFAAAGYESLIFGQPTYNGVAILYKSMLAGQVELIQKGLPDDPPDAQRRLLAARIAGTTVIDVYIPNGQAVGSEKYAFKLEWLDRLRKFLDSSFDPAQPLALCGDFNVAPDPVDVHDPALWEGKVLFSLPERAAMQTVKDWGLHDSFRELYPAVAEYSWWDYRQAAFRRNLGLRIDHIWTTGSLFERCRQVVIDKEPRTWERPSDHTPVIATFDI